MALTATAGPSSRAAIGEGFAAIATSIPLAVPALDPVVVDGGLWYAADGGRLLRFDPRTSTSTEMPLDPTQFSDRVGLAGDPLNLWITGADDHSVGVLDATNLEIGRIPAVTAELMVIDKVDRAVAEGGSLWFVADVHASQDILGTPCCNGFTAKMLYRADVASATMSQLGQLDAPVAIGVRSGVVWILSRPSGADGSLRLDGLAGRTGTVVATVALPAAGPGADACGGCISSLLVGSNSLWLPTGSGNTLVRIDPIADRVEATIDLGRDVELVLESPDGYIWVAGGSALGGSACAPADGYLSVIDPSTNRVVRDGTLACPVSLVVIDGDVWVGTDGPDGPSLRRIQPPA